MNVPQLQNLSSQNFNSEFVGFTWEFPTTKIEFTVTKDGTHFLKRNDLGGDGFLTSGIISTENVSADELIKLRDDVIKFLNE